MSVPEWIEKVEDIGTSQAAVTVIRRDGKRVGFVLPRLSLTEQEIERKESVNG